MGANTKSRGARRSGKLGAVFRLARWLPTLAFVAVFADGGDLTYLACAAAFSIWPAIEPVRYE